MKKNARIIITFTCNRNCNGCCNKSIEGMKSLNDISELSNYKEFIITGGEPFVLGDNLLKVINILKTFNVPLVIYSAWYSGNESLYKEILSKIDKLTFTLHYDSEDNEKDIKELYELSKILPKNLSARLSLDDRFKNEFNSDYLNKWDVRKLVWKDFCPIPENEDLLYIDYKKIIEWGKEA